MIYPVNTKSLKGLNIKQALLLIVFLFAAHSSFSQGIFEETFDDCNGNSSCLYCGDSAAYYTKSLGAYIVDKIEHSVVNSTYELKNFDVYYEVFVDSAGNTCVLSDKSLGFGWSWRMKDDVRRWLNDMPDWKPAVKNGAKINSTVIVECKFRDNFLQTKYVKDPPKSVHKKKKD